MLYKVHLFFRISYQITDMYVGSDVYSPFYNVYVNFQTQMEKSQ